MIASGINASNCNYNLITIMTINEIGKLIENCPEIGIHICSFIINVYFILIHVKGQLACIANIGLKILLVSWRMKMEKIKDFLFISDDTA